MSHQTPPPPPLPEMTKEERILWATSHKLPANMVLVAASEMMEINRAIRLIDGENKAWRQRFGFLVGTENVDEAGKAVLELRSLRRDALLLLDEAAKTFSAEDTDMADLLGRIKAHLKKHLK